MDTQWDFRKIYNEARLEKVAQDEWCSSVEAAIEEPAVLGRLKKYPQSSLRLEAVVDTLRGKVLVNAHCVSVQSLKRKTDETDASHLSLIRKNFQYEATDLDALIRLSNEFK